MSKSELCTTYMEEPDVFQCNYCGAYAGRSIDIEHHESCTRDKGKKQYDYMNGDE